MISSGKLIEYVFLRDEILTAGWHARFAGRVRRYGQDSGVCVQTRFNGYVVEIGQAYVSICVGFKAYKSTSGNPLNPLSAPRIRTFEPQPSLSTCGIARVD